MAPLIGKKAGSEQKQRQLPLMARKLHANACKVAAGMIQSDAGETAVSNLLELTGSREYSDRRVQLSARTGVRFSDCAGIDIFRKCFFLVSFMLVKLVRPFHLKLFYSGKLIHASIISKIENKCIISTSSNNRLYRETLGEHAPKNDQRASEKVAEVLLGKIKKKEVGFIGCELESFMQA